MLIVSEQGDSPIDILIASKTDNFPLFARARRESYRFDTPQKVAKVLTKCVARFYQKSRLTVRSLPPTRDFAPAPGQTTGYVFPSFGVKKITSHLPGRKSRVGGRDRTVNLDFEQNLGTI